MKIKIFALMATMLLLMGTTAIAQSDNTKKETTEGNIKGDVNGDGVVDVADIAAVIAVMHEQGTVETKYYWYVGTSNPAEMTSISPIVTDNTSPGWRLIGTSVPAYDKTNPLWNSDKGKILFGDTKVTAYLAIPSANIKYRNDITGEDITSDGWEPLSSKNINDVNYNLYKSTGTLKRFVQTWY